MPGKEKLALAENTVVAQNVVKEFLGLSLQRMSLQLQEGLT